MVVHGRTSYRRSGALQAIEGQSGRQKFFHFTGFAANPRIDDLLRGVATLEAVAPDMILAVGGGSAIDTAKLITVLSANDADPVALITGQVPIRRQGLPLVAVPTTAGSGSQATHFAVVYLAMRKYSVAHPAIMPDVAIVDPDLTRSLSHYQTAVSGFDAICQSIESYWNILSTDESKDLAERAIRKILPAIKPAVSHRDHLARSAMAEASHLSGMAINITKTTAPHAFSYPFTVLFGVPHGHAVAILLGRFWEINQNASEEDVLDPRGKQYLDTTMQKLFEMFSCNEANECAAYWYRLMSEVGLATNIGRLGVRGEEDIMAIVDGVNMERLQNHPVRVNGTVLRHVLKGGI